MFLLARFPRVGGVRSHATFELVLQSATRAPSRKPVLFRGRYSWFCPSESPWPSAKPPKEAMREIKNKNQPLFFCLLPVLRRRRRDSTSKHHTPTSKKNLLLNGANAAGTQGKNSTQKRDLPAAHSGSKRKTGFLRLRRPPPRTERQWKYQTCTTRPGTSAAADPRPYTPQKKKRR